jgi:ATP-binding cassette subfamily F protein uup
VLSDGDLYARQPAKFAEASKALEALQGELAKAEEQWLELEMMREALEAG